MQHVIRSGLLVAVLAPLLLACGEAASPTCACTTAGECGEGMVCEHCRCIERCDVSGECPDGKPNCDPGTGLCQPPCPDYDCPPDRPTCGEGGVCAGPCSGPEGCPPDLPNCGPDGICVGPCQTAADCPDPAAPNCDPSSGLCRGPCPGVPCPAELPNCDGEGLCYEACFESGDCPAAAPNCDTSTGRCVGPCASNSGCPDPDEPNCDPSTGLCQGTCPDTPCPEGMVNCSAEGECLGPCESAADCADPAAPNCGPDGVCFAPCETSADCRHPDFPNCDGATGLCFGPCSTGEDCLDPAAPNCDAGGMCFGRCASHEDCINPDLPNCNGATGLCHGPCVSHDDCEDPAAPDCDLDPASATAGLCLPPCATNADCPSALYPDCDPTPGVCLPPCTADEDCPEETFICDVASGLCFLPGCVEDADCSPPDTVCEAWTCVPGCDGHADCPADERCNLVGPEGLYHCEARDCLADADCTSPGTVCDTDGLVDPAGGGTCAPGCRTTYDCRRIGYDCDGATGRCAAHDYGDVGADCAAGCASGFCLAAEGSLCTAFCCTQHDCPAGWACRPHDDGSGAGRSVDVCVPLDPAHGTRRYDEICADGSDCRSAVCTGHRCMETCCTDADCDAPFVSGMHCAASWIDGVTACAAVPSEGDDPLGTPGCATSGDPGDCLSDLCFSFYTPDTGCRADAECTPARPTCWDLGGDGTNDCVRDFCVDHCCSERDCPDAGGDIFACSKWLYGTSDYNICLLVEGTALLPEGDACTANSACRSMVCSDAARVCRGRCCTDEDCTDPRFPRCALELDHIFSSSVLLNVCLP
jgi:hypothetical protein